LDYFFQTHLADFYCERGLDFDALDLRKYGRSLRDHQTPNFVTSLATYSAGVDEAVRLIRTVDGHDSLLVNGHSTGGLITALWAHHRRGNGVVDGLFLNSPFLDLNAGWATRTLSTRGVEQLARAKPHAIVPRRSANTTCTACTASTREAGIFICPGSRRLVSACTRVGWPRSVVVSGSSREGWPSMSRC
jgi:alpha-beta hydrolase superfamily lysophospholipase